MVSLTRFQGSARIGSIHSNPIGSIMFWLARLILNLLSNANKVELKGESMRQKRKKIVTFVTKLARLMVWNPFQHYNGTDYSDTMEPKQTLHMEPLQLYLQKADNLKENRLFIFF